MSTNTEINETFIKYNDGERVTSLFVNSNPTFK